MAKPPAGFSIQKGRYFTADGQGPYVWNGTTMVLVGTSAGLPPAMLVPFSGAVANSLVWVGQGVVTQVVLTASAVGSIDMSDGLTAGVGVAIGGTLTTTATPETFLINGGAGIQIYGGILLTVAGANTGYIVVRES